jgi:hypothetical protein
MLIRLTIGLSAIGLLAGCSPQPAGEGLSPVQGQVLVRGRPAVNAFVVLHPLAPADVSAPRPHGLVDAQGIFRLGTHAADDGAAPGEYAVTIQWFDNSRSKTDDERGPNAQSDLLRGRYSDPRHPKALRVRIAAGPNTLPPFRL